MPIEGPIRELGVSDLLQLLCVSRRTGDLTAVHARSESSLTIRLEEGMIVGVAGLPPELRLGRLAVLWGRTSESEVARALTRQRSMAARRLGEILLEQDAIGEAEVRRLLDFQVAETIFEMLRWDDGQIGFQDEPPRSEGVIDIRLTTDSVLLDAVRRMDEMAEITGVDARLDPLPRLAEQGNGTAAVLSLRPLEWAALAEVDGTRTLRGIARALGRSELEVARALQALIVAGVVEMRITAERSSPAEPGTDDPVRSAIEAVTGFISSGDLVEANRRIEALLLRNPDSAMVHTLKGIVETKSGDAEGGLRHFDRAIEIDPLHEPAYFHLASALVGRGELKRARREIDTFLALASPADPRRSRANVLLAGLTQTLGALEESE